jgi:hypothetical protein
MNVGCLQLAVFTVAPYMLHLPAETKTAFIPDAVYSAEFLTSTDDAPLDRRSPTLACYQNKTDRFPAVPLPRQFSDSVHRFTVGRE